MAFLASLFDHTKKDVARSWKTVEKINALKATTAALSDDALRAKTAEFKEQLAEGASLDALLPEAFAVVREATWRVLGRRQYRFWIQRQGVQATGTSGMDELIVAEGEREETERRLKSEGRTFSVERYMEPFDVQMIGGMMLHRGMIAEMKTGEGKTLVAAAPLYLNALTGRGAHLVTTNDFLVRYQGNVMGALYHFLGLTTAVIQSSRGDGRLPAYIFEPGYNEPDGLPNCEMRPISRYEAYRADILYTTNNEIGFDYLRDNIAMDISQVTQRELHYAIVDEVDNILIDEARTPLIISGPGDKPSELYGVVDRVMKQLRPEVDFIIDEKSKNATLTEEGTSSVERSLGVTNIADPENLEVFTHVQSALRANACYQRDRDYIVKDGEVIIVDEFTGHLMYGRRFSEGLHQAIEAKEGVKVERESKTWATITFQNFFRLYDKLSGMTGTAKTEEQEFIKIYGLPVAVIPTHRPVQRKDHADMVFKSEEAKLRGIVGEILQAESRRQPVLVGTRSIEVSERISARLKPDLLQAFTLASVLHRHVSGMKTFNERQRLEFTGALKARAIDVRHDRDHLHKALENLQVLQSPNSLRLVQPEEIRQMELRLERVQELDTEIAALHDRIRDAGELKSEEARRLAEILCFQRLEDIRIERLSKLMEVCGMSPRPADQDTVARLGEIIGLSTDLDRLASLLQKGVPHHVLNAKAHEHEAYIIAQAGRSGAVTIATNMAGRGIDIMLGGNPTGMVDDIIDEWGYSRLDCPEEIREKALAEARRRCSADRELVVKLGGLAIIGSERHESRRIDNQLRGRSGRQGDPGQSRFYVSMQDELMRLFGPERFSLLLKTWEEGEPIAHGLISRQIESAQKKVEGRNFEVRQHVLKYDDVVNQQRKAIYSQRRQVLEGEDMRSTVESAILVAVERRVRECANEATAPGSWDIEQLSRSLLDISPGLPLFFAPEELRLGPSNPLFEAQYRARVWQSYQEGLRSKTRVDDLLELVTDKVMEAYDAHEEEQGEENMRTLERLVILRVVDELWMSHLDAVDFLREGIGLRSYEQTDPVVAFTKEASTMWDELIAEIQEKIAHSILRVRLVREEEEHRRQTKRQPVSGGESEETHTGDRVAHATVRANDPCPCGSGKKYKKCCSKSAVA